MQTLKEVMENHKLGSTKANATRDLTELDEKFKILKRTGDIGAGTNYILIGS